MNCLHSIYKCLIAILTLVTISVSNVFATDTEAKTLLILNSYNENSPWSKSVIDPVNYYVAQQEGVQVSIVHFNSTIITDSTTYEQVRQNVIANYFTPDVAYVVFVGNLAFSLRDDVKARLGEDTPMLLLTRDMSNLPVSYYFSGYDNDFDYDSAPTVSELLPYYNFSVIYAPDLYRETIDLMMRMIPDMEELVYLSDANYYNHYRAREIENYLVAEYPDLKYTYVKASYSDSKLLSDYLVQRHPNTGLLLSSWFYEAPGALGYPTVVSGEISLLSSSKNPVFSLRQSYLKLGAVGGVYLDAKKVGEYIDEYLHAMFEGRKMNEMPFVLNHDTKMTMLSYPQVKEYGLSTSNCPSNVVMIDRPLSFWDKYHWQTLIAAIVIGLIIYLLARRNVVQRHEIESLSRHKRFVDTMPIPYTKARVIYNDYMNAIFNIQYMMSNQAFDELISENSDPKHPGMLFTPEFIAAKTQEMIERGKPVTFLHHFEHTDKYYMFTLCLVDSFRKHSKDVVDTIDIFAIDVTNSQKNEASLKSLTQRLDMIIDVANIIPWEWDPQPDIMRFDAYSMFHRLKRSFDDNHFTKGESVVNTSEYMKLVYPEDREIVRSFREKLLMGNTDDFEMQYRLVVARQNQEKLEWVNVRGTVTEVDEDGKPLHVMGSMMVITDKKEQEVAVLDAQRRSDNAEARKDSFVNSISREIRMHLNSIVGFASLIDETADPAKRKTFVGYINQNTQQLLDFVDKMVENASNDQLIGDTANTQKKPQAPMPTPPQAPNKPAPSQHDVTPPIPAAPKSPRPNPVAVPPLQVPEPPTAPKRDTTRPVVLVAEDIEGNFLLLNNFIPKKYEVIHAWTGKEAVDLFKSRHPDIILMDIGMPIMDGYKATAEIRKFSTTVPIVAVTAYTSNSDRSLILQSGFDDYVPKPVDKNTILTVLERYVGK